MRLGSHDEFFRNFRHDEAMQKMAVERGEGEGEATSSFSSPAYSSSPSSSSFSGSAVRAVHHHNNNLNTNNNNQNGRASTARRSHTDGNGNANTDNSRQSAFNASPPSSQSVSDIPAAQWSESPYPLSQARSLSAIIYFDSKIIIGGGCTTINCTERSSLLESIDPSSKDNALPVVTIIGELPVFFEVKNITNPTMPPKIVRAAVARAYSLVTVETITAQLTATSRLWLVGPCATYIQKDDMQYEDIVLMNALHGGLWGLSHNLSAVDTSFSLPSNVSLRANASCIAYLNRIFIVGGVNLNEIDDEGNFVMLDTIDAYDIRNGTYYSSILKLKSVRMNAAVAVDNAMLYVAGGQTRRTVFNNQTKRNETEAVLSSDTEAFLFSLLYLFNESAKFTRVNLPQNQYLATLSASLSSTSSSSSSYASGSAPPPPPLASSVSSSIASSSAAANPNLWSPVRIFSFGGYITVTLGTYALTTLQCLGGFDPSYPTDEVPCLNTTGQPSSWDIGPLNGMQGQTGASVFAFPSSAIASWFGIVQCLYAVGGTIEGSVMNANVYYAFTTIHASNPIGLQESYSTGIITLTFNKIASGWVRLSPNVDCYGSTVVDMYLNTSNAVGGMVNLTFLALSQSPAVFLCFAFGSTNIPILNLTNTSSGNGTVIGYQNLYGCLNALTPFSIVNPTPARRRQSFRPHRHPQPPQSFRRRCLLPRRRRRPPTLRPTPIMMATMTTTTVSPTGFATRPMRLSLHACWRLLCWSLRWPYFWFATISGKGREASSSAASQATEEEKPAAATSETRITTATATSTAKGQCRTATTPLLAAVVAARGMLSTLSEEGRRVAKTMVAMTFP